MDGAEIVCAFDTEAPIPDGELRRAIQRALKGALGRDAGPASLDAILRGDSSDDELRRARFLIELEDALEIRFAAAEIAHIFSGTDLIALLTIKVERDAL